MINENEVVSLRSTIESILKTKSDSKFREAKRSIYKNKVVPIQSFRSKASHKWFVHMIYKNDIDKVKQFLLQTSN